MHPLLLGCVALLQTAMFRGDLAHTAVYRDTGIAKLGGVKWRFHTGGRVIASPAIVGQTAYVGCTDGNLYAVDLGQGTMRWKLKTGARITSSPAVSNGVVYVVSYDGNLYAVDAASGTQRWKFATQGERRFAGTHLHGILPVAERMPDPFDVFLSSPAVSNGIVYFGSGDGYVYAVDAASGTLRWKYQTGDVIHASPAIANATVYIGSWDSWFYWQTVARRQDGRCAGCGKVLLAFNEDADRDVFGHHVIPDQCGKHRPQYAGFLRTAENCVLICKECHWAAHEYGKYEFGIVANPDFFKKSHGKDMAAHRTWCKTINDRWGLLFPAAKKKTP